MKKIFVVALAILLLVALIFGGCAKPAPEPTPTAPPTPTPTPTPTPSPEEKWEPPIPGMKQGEEDLYIEWTYGTAGPRSRTPPGFELTEAENLLAELEKATGGRFKVKFNYNIIPSRPDVIPSVGTGLVDMSASLPIYHPAELPLATIIELWGWHGGDLDHNTLLIKYVFSHPLVTENLAKMNVVYAASGSADPFKLIVGKGVKKVETAEDLAGLRLGATGYRTLWAEKLGMIPVSVTVMDMYEFLEKGMVDMIGANVGMTMGFRLHEVAGSIIELALGGPTSFEIVNKDKWESLPQYIKDLWWELVPTYYTKYNIEMTVARRAHLDGIYKEKGVESYPLPPAEEAKLEAALQPMWEAWTTDKAKYPGGAKIKEFLKDCIAYRDKVTGKPFTIYTP